jgi:hypothetical protein
LAGWIARARAGHARSPGSRAPPRIRAGLSQASALSGQP